MKAPELHKRMPATKPCVTDVLREWEPESLMSVKLFARNSRARNGCSNFMGAWDFGLFLQQNLHAHKIPRLGVGDFGVCGGGSANSILTAFSGTCTSAPNC